MYSILLKIIITTPGGVNINILINYMYTYIYISIKVLSLFNNINIVCTNNKLVLLNLQKIKLKRLSNIKNCSSYYKLFYTINYHWYLEEHLFFYNLIVFTIYIMT